MSKAWNWRCQPVPAVCSPTQQMSVQCNALVVTSERFSEQSDGMLAAQQVLSGGGGGPPLVGRYESSTSMQCNMIPLDLLTMLKNARGRVFHNATQHDAIPENALLGGRQMSVIRCNAVNFRNSGRTDCISIQQCISILENSL